jgi:hypothetical protein
VIQIKRAITMAEALLDAHFAALSLNAAFHAPTRAALTRAIENIATADEAALELESALGLWTHISRVIESGGEHVTPSTALYQLERLRF